MSKTMRSLFILAIMAIMPNVAFAQTNQNIEELSKIWEDYVRTGKVIIPNTISQQEETQQNSYQQQQYYGGNYVNDNNYVNQTTPSQDYLSTSSVNGQSAEGMIDNSGYSSSSSTTTSGNTNNSRIRRDVNAESRAKSSAHSNPTGASLSRAKTYERNNNIKYGRGR